MREVKQIKQIISLEPCSLPSTSGFHFGSWDYWYCCNLAVAYFFLAGSDRLSQLVLWHLVESGDGLRVFKVVGLGPPLFEHWVRVLTNDLRTSFSSISIMITCDLGRKLSFSLKVSLLFENWLAGELIHLGLLHELLSLHASCFNYETGGWGSCYCCC